MLLFNIKTGRTKVIDYDKWNIGELVDIYKFYSTHKDYMICIEGVFEL